MFNLSAREVSEIARLVYNSALNFNASVSTPNTLWFWMCRGR
jgi:hypothetical protein